MKRVSTHDLAVGFGSGRGSVQALAGVNVAFEAGRIAMLVGPNGAGKSTLMKVLLGLIRPDAGRIELDGRPVAIDNAWKRHIGYLPEAVAFSENLNGRQLLRFFAHARGVDRRRVDRVLERVGLAPAARRPIRGYSRGMRQRLGLGVSILSEPELLVLDEPTSGLDQEGLTVLWSVLDEWRSASRLVPISSHDLALLERRVDDVCVLRSGHVLASGTAEELRDASALPHRVSFILEAAALKNPTALCAALRALGHGPVEAHDDRIVCDVPQEAVLELIEAQGRFPGSVVNVRVEEPTLDVVYDALLETS